MGGIASWFGLGGDTSTSSTSSATASSSQGLQDVQGTNLYSFGNASGVNLTATDYGALGMAGDIINKTLDIAKSGMVTSSDQIDRAMELTARSANATLLYGDEQASKNADFLKTAVNGSLTYAGDQIDKNTNLLKSVGNAVLNFVNDTVAVGNMQTDKAMDLTARSADASLKFAADTIGLNNEQLNKAMDVTTKSANASLVFASDQTKQSNNAIIAAADASLKFANDQSLLFDSHFNQLLDSNNTTNDRAISALAQGQTATTNALQSFADQSFTFAGQSFTKAIDSIQTANNQERDFVKSTLADSSALTSHALDVVAQNASSTFDKVSNFSGQVLSDIQSQAGANLEAVTAAQRSDAANSLDNVVKVAGFAFVAMAVAAVFFSRKAA